MAKGWCKTGEGGDAGGAIWHNPAEVVLEGKKIVVIEDDHRYASPRKSEFAIDGLAIEIQEKSEVLENGIQVGASLFLKEKGGNWFSRVLNTLLGRKEIKFEASERAAFESLCEQVRCQRS